MAASGFTPIQLYRTTTAAAVPVNTNLADGELAINTTDEKLYFKNAAGVVKLLAANVTAVANGGTGATSLTANSVILGNGTSAVQTVAPGTSGNVLASNGTTWVSQAAPSSTSISQLDTNVTITDGVTSFTASVASSATTIQASQSGTTLTVTVVQGASPIVIGATISGFGFLPNTVVTAFGTGTGGTGTYIVSTSHGITTTTANLVYSTMTVTAVASGTLAAGQCITNAPSSAATSQTIPTNTSITAFGTGTGGTGTYILDRVFVLNSSTVFAGGSVTTVVDGQNVKITAGGNSLIRTVPQFNDSQGAILSNRLMGSYATRTAGSGTPYYADYNGTGTITAADALDINRIQLLLNQVSPRILSYACAYGTNGPNVGLGFSAFSLADVSAIASGLSPSQIPGAVNTVAVGHLTQVGARITFNKYGIDPLNSGNVRTNTTTYVAAEHQFLGGPVSLGGFTTITAATSAIASTWTYVIFNVAGTATVTLQTQNAVINGRIDDGANTAAGTTLTVNTVTGQAIFVGMLIFVPGLATEYVTVTAFGTGTGGAGTYTVSGAAARIISTQMISSGPTSGRMLAIKTIQNQSVNSAASNVVPLNSATAGTAILPAAAGRWATLVFDGTNWQIMASN